MHWEVVGGPYPKTQLSHFASTLFRSCFGPSDSGPSHFGPSHLDPSICVPSSSMPTPGSRSAAAAKASNLFLDCAQCFSRQLNKEVAESLRATNFQAQGNKNRPPDQNKKKTSIQTLLDRPNHVEDEMHAVCHRWKTACISSFT